MTDVIDAMKVIAIVTGTAAHTLRARVNRPRAHGTFRGPLELAAFAQ